MTPIQYVLSAKNVWFPSLISAHVPSTQLFHSPFFVVYLESRDDNNSRCAVLRQYPITEEDAWAGVYSGGTARKHWSVDFSLRQSRCALLNLASAQWSMPLAKYQLLRAAVPQGRRTWRRFKDVKCLVWEKSRGKLPACADSDTAGGPSLRYSWRTPYDITNEARPRTSRGSINAEPVNINIICVVPSGSAPGCVY